MRTVALVPRGVQRDLALELGEMVRDEDAPRALVLRRADEALDDHEAPVPADRPEALLDSSPTAPTAKRRRDELLAVVRDEVLGRYPGPPDNVREEHLDLCGRWEAREYHDSHGAARVVVDHDGEPPAEGPALRKRERQPRRPEAERRGNRGELDPRLLRTSSVTVSTTLPRLLTSSSNVAGAPEADRGDIGPLYRTLGGAGTRGQGRTGCFYRLHSKVHRQHGLRDREFHRRNQTRGPF